MGLAWDIAMHPLSGAGYQFWSGVGGALAVPVVIGGLVWVWPTRCQELGCYRRARRRHPGHGLPVCARHL